MRSSQHFVLSIAALCLAGSALGSGEPKLETPPASVEKKTPEQEAAESYNAGISSRDDAWRLEKKGGDPAKIAKAYARAVQSFESATAANPRMHQAWGALGYARRQTGDYEGALAAYDRALVLKPDYLEAVEYLGEAYLGLDRIADARTAYERLHAADGKLAGELLGAMQSWIAARRAEPHGVKVGELDEFERWVAERAQGEPPPSSLHKSRSW